MRHRSPGRISSSSSSVEARLALSWILAGIGTHCLTSGATSSMERDTVAWPTPKTSAATSWVAYVLQWNGSRSTRLRRSSANLRPAPIARFRGLLESLSLSASG